MIDDKKYNPISYPVKITCKAADLISIDLLKKFQGNLKTLSDSNRDKLVKSICLKGFTAPFFVWLHDDIFNLLDGSQRYETLLYMREIGWEIPDLPVAYIEADSVKDAKSKLLAITSQYGEFNKDEVQNWIDELKDFDTELAESIRLVDEEFDLKFQDGELAETVGDDEVSEDVEPITKLGDLWELGEHRLLCGDSTNCVQIDILMDNKKADMVFTSPPYNADAKTGDGDIFNKKKSKEMYVGEYSDNMGSTEYLDFTRKVLDNTFLYTDGFVFWNVSYNANSRYEYIKQIYTKIEYLIEQICWKKSSTIPFKGSLMREWEPIYVFSTNKQSLKLKDVYGNYWAINNTNSQQEDHKACFPVELPMKGIDLINKNTGIILEPFCGAGTTLIACEKKERQCYGLELDPHYCDVIVNRYKTWCEKNGKTPVIKLNGNIYNG